MKQIIDCPQCKELKSVESFWPFCSPKCKTEYADTHYIKKQRKYQTVEQCQERIKEIIDEKRKKFNLFKPIQLGNEF